MDRVWNPVVKIIGGVCALLTLHGLALAQDGSSRGATAAPRQPDAGAPEAAPAPPPPVAGWAAPPPAPPPRSPVVQSNAPTFAPRRAPPSDRWPIEYVLRPQTIPEGGLQVALASSATLVDSNFQPGPGIRYSNFYQEGGSVTFGGTDRLELTAFVPGLFCESSSARSGCGDYARLDDSGFGFGFGVLRTPTVQLEAKTSVYVAMTKPLTVAFDIGARTKVLLANRVAIELALAVDRWINSPLVFPAPYFYFEATGWGSAVLDLNLQATRHLLVWFDLAPNAPLQRLGEPRLEVFGGSSWTFDNATQLGLRAGTFNVLARHDWDISLPAKYVTLTLQFWI